MSTYVCYRHYKLSAQGLSYLPLPKPEVGTISAIIEKMLLPIAVFSALILCCSAVEPRVRRPARVQTTVARPGDSIVAVTEPECKFQNDNGQCCLTVNLTGLNGIENCVRIGKENGTGFVSYLFSGHELARKDLSVGNSCFSVPNSPFKACIHVYFADILPTQKEGNVCMYASINQVISLDFNCIKYIDGKYLHNREHTPESQGIFGVYFANGLGTVYLGKPVEE